MVSHFFRSRKIARSLYTGDRHTCLLQVSLSQGAFTLLEGDDARNFAAAKSAIFVVAYYLIKLN